MAWNPTVTETPFGTAVTAHAANIGATVDAGDALIPIFAWRNAARTLSSGPAGFTQKLAPTTQGSGNAAANFTIYAKVADGSEDGGTATFTTDDVVTGAAQVIRIPASEWSGDLADFLLGTVGQGLVSNPNPPGVTAPNVGENNLYIVFLGATDDDATVSTYSTNYTGGVDTISGAGANDGATVAVSFRALTADSDDPGAMALSEVENVIVLTGVIAPAAAPAGGAVGRGLTRSPLLARRQLVAMPQRALLAPPRLWMPDRRLAA